MDDKEIQQFTKFLMEAGIQLYANYEPIGCPFFLRPSDITGFIRDRDAFFAAECGLEKEEYQEWKIFMAEGRKCTAKTRIGHCKRTVRDSSNLSPQDFNRRKKESSLLCSWHEKK